MSGDKVSNSELAHFSLYASDNYIINHYDMYARLGVFVCARKTREQAKLIIAFNGTTIQLSWC